MATLKRRPQRYEEIANVGPSRAEKLRQEVGTLKELTRGGSNATRNRLSSATSGRRNDLPAYGENIVTAAHGAERNAIDVVDSSLVEGSRQTQDAEPTTTSGGFTSRAEQRKNRVKEGEAEAEGNFTQLDQFGDALDLFKDEYQGETTFTGPDPTTMREGVEESNAPDEFVSVLPSAVNQRSFLQFPSEDKFEENVESQAGRDDAVEPAKEAFVEFVDQDIGLGPSMRTVGEYRVSSDEYEEAQEEFAQQSPEAKRVDKRRRAPITTDEDVYAQAPGRYDFPGVDTPSNDPQVRQKDRNTVDADDTTLEQTEGSLFVRENNATGGVTPSLKGLFSGGRSPGPDVTNPAAEIAAQDLGADVESDSGGEAVADVMFLERETDEFGEELIPFGAEESDRQSFEF